MEALRERGEDAKLEVRVGIGCGELSAGVAGQSQPRYHVHGKALARASKMEKTSKPSQVHLCDRSTQFIPAAMRVRYVKWRRSQSVF